jgi:hypothetical protein
MRWEGEIYGEMGRDGEGRRDEEEGKEIYGEMGRRGRSMGRWGGEERWGR